MMNHYQQQQQPQQNMQMGSGLTRNRSAPSSYFSSFLNNSRSSSDGGFGADDFAQLFNPRASSPETQRIFARFMNSPDTIQENCPSNMNLQSQSQSQSQFLPPRKIEPAEEQPQQQQRNDYSAVSQMMYRSHNSEASSSAMGSSYDRILVSINSNRVPPQIKMEPAGSGSSGNSSLIRHSSSPAGLFANINIESEFGAMRGMGSVGDGNIANAEATFSSASANDGDYITGFPVNPWEDASVLSDDFLKGLAEDTDDKLFPKANASDDHQKNESGNGPTTLLSHHLSLPKSTSAMEKLLQESVPCKIRAKRGCATHPRSIAERVRRTKISERMRKLQELVPNMEKQTSTADMLDLAVDYIKDLQRQVKMLSDNHAKCSCSAKRTSS